MSFFFPLDTFKVDTSKLLVVDSTSKFLFPSTSTSIITTPYTSPVLAISGPTLENIKPVYTFPLAPYLDLNKDPEVHDTVVSSVYRQTFQNWLYTSDFEELFQYIKIVNGDAKLITSSKEKDKHYDNGSIDKKVRFIRDNILSRGRVKKILEEFVDGTRTNWYDIEKNTFFVKELIFKYMKKKLKALVEKKEK